MIFHQKTTRNSHGNWTSIWNSIENLLNIHSNPMTSSSSELRWVPWIPGRSSGNDLGPFPARRKPGRWGPETRNPGRKPWNTGKIPLENPRKYGKIMEKSHGTMEKIYGNMEKSHGNIGKFHGNMGQSHGNMGRSHGKWGTFCHTWIVRRTNLYSGLLDRFSSGHDHQKQWFNYDNWWLEKNMEIECETNHTLWFSLDHLGEYGSSG